MDELSGVTVVTTISPGAEVLVAINVFTVAPENQARLIELLTRATESTVSRAPGFISAALHRSRDGRRVTMYAQWRSWEHYERMRADSTSSPFLAEALTFASFEPGFYHVARVFSPGGARP
jgi:quinol monooxygenase YgiN